MRSDRGSPKPLGTADLVLHGGHILTLGPSQTIAEALAVKGDRILAAGRSADMLAMAGPDATVIDLRGRTAMPGLIDGHAHADREGLKSLLPSLSGVTSIADIQDRVAEEVARAAPGAWIVFNPIGDPPEFSGMPRSLREGRMPNRLDLDKVAPHNPIYIRAPWGYWPNELPLSSSANSAALRAAGIDRSTPSPSPLVTIDKDPACGEPTGVFIEQTKEPIVEFTLMARAPNFTVAQRAEALVHSMRAYNSVGTTSVFEGHGISQDVIAAYQQVRNAGQQTLRAHLVFSPSWGSATRDDVRLMLASWSQWLARKGLGDHWLRVADIYTEINDAPETRLRRRVPVQTGWAGYSPDSGLPRDAVCELLLEAARNGIRVSGIWVNLLELFREVDRIVPIAGRRWVLGHQRVLDRDQVELICDLGLALTTHTNRHIYKEGAAIRSSVGRDKEHTIVPIRTLLDKNVPVAFGTDGVPPTLFNPVWQAVERVDRTTGEVIAPGQRISRLEALHCATTGGACLTFEETEKGTLQPGMLADIVVLTEDPLSVEASRLRDIVAAITIVGGRVTYVRDGSRDVAATPMAMLQA
ncbi:MAG: amidohydrolase family protein [Xanthobacteraceae bacterium]|nr:amidohydrolase family protein [Xanthobacteraceae bacterium]